ncbi:UNVERIFIED_ORG: hypothetical protein M2348_001093 [Sphingomonas sp. R1F5B]
MSAPNDLALHLATQAHANPLLAYLIGPGSRTWELLVGAVANITGESTDAAGKRLSANLVTTPVRPEPIKGHGETETDLRQGVSPAVHEVLDLLENDAWLWDSCFSPDGLIESASGYASAAFRASNPGHQRTHAIEAAARLIHAAERLAQ